MNKLVLSNSQIIPTRELKTELIFFNPLEHLSNINPKTKKETYKANFMRFTLMNQSEIFKESMNYSSDWHYEKFESFLNLFTNLNYKFQMLKEENTFGNISKRKQTIRTCSICGSLRIYKGNKYYCNDHKRAKLNIKKELVEIDNRYKANIYKLKTSIISFLKQVDKDYFYNLTNQRLENYTYYLPYLEKLAEKSNCLTFDEYIDDWAKELLQENGE